MNGNDGYNQISLHASYLQFPTIYQGDNEFIIRQDELMSPDSL